MKGKIMSKKEIIIVLIMVFAIFSTTGEIRSEEAFCCASGDVFVTILDSIITVKFDPQYPIPNYGLFATEIKGLDESEPVIHDYREFVIYHIKEGCDGITRYSMPRHYICTNK